MAFQASGMSDGDSCLVSLTAVNGLTRWALDDNDKLPTQSHTSFSGKFYKIDDKPKVWGLDAPDDGNKDLAWGKYEIDFQCSPDLSI